MATPPVGPSAGKPQALGKACDFRIDPGSKWIGRRAGGRSRSAGSGLAVVAVAVALAGAVGAVVRAEPGHLLLERRDVVGRPD